MELLLSETTASVAAETWATISAPVVGPGVVVFLVTCPGDTEMIHAQVALYPDGAGLPTMVEDVIANPTDIDSWPSVAGFQSAPVPLLDATYGAALRAKHDSTTPQGFVVRVLKL